jgi:hypothetical protein
MGGYLLNYNKWRALYESTQLNEAINPDMPQPLEAGIKMDAILPIKYDDEPKPEFAIFSKIAYYNTLMSRIDKIPEMYLRSSLASTGAGVVDKKQAAVIVNNILYGIFWRSGLTENKELRKSLGIDGGNDNKQFLSFREKYGYSSEAAKLGIKISEPIEVPINMKFVAEVPAELGGLGGRETIKAKQEAYIKYYTLGYFKNGLGPLLKPDEEQFSFTNPMIAYINTYNLKNFQNGHNKQYVLKINSAGYTDLSETEEVENKLILYAANAAASTTVTRTETEEGTEGTTETTGAQPGGTGSAAIGYGNMKYNLDDKNVAIDANHPEVKRCATEIVTALGESTTVKLDSITITSSASTSWNGVKMAASNGTGDPSKGKLTETTFATDKTALGNQYLAWLRGKTFAAALKSALGEIAFDTESINWKVSDEGLAGGKNISFEWTKVSNPGTTYTKPANLVKKVSATAATTKKAAGKDSGIIYKYEFTWNNSLFGGK